MPICQRGVNAYLIFAVLNASIWLWKAKSPVFLVVGRPVGNPLGMIRKRKQMRLEFAEWHGRVHRSAVIHDVQVAFAKIHKSHVRANP